MILLPRTPPRTRIRTRKRKRKKTMKTMTLPASCLTNLSPRPLLSPPLSSHNLPLRYHLAPPRACPMPQPRKSQRRLVASLKKMMTKTMKSKSKAQAQTVRSLRLLCSSNRMYKPYITLLLLMYLNKTMPLLLFLHQVLPSKARHCRSPMPLFLLLRFLLRLLLPSQSPACLRTVLVSSRTESLMTPRVMLMLGLT